MSKDQQYQLFTQIEVAAGTEDSMEPNHDNGNREVVDLLRALLASQNRQNELLQEMINQFGAGQRQRAMELAKWKQANPHLAWSCRNAAEKLSKIQTDFLAGFADEVGDNFENLLDSEYCISDFLDRYGPRFVHLTAILQILSQLASSPETPNTVAW